MQTFTIANWPSSQASVKKLAQHRLADLDRKLSELTAIRDALAVLVKRCSGVGPLRGCPIIEDVLAQQEPYCQEK